MEVVVLYTKKYLCITVCFYFHSSDPNKPVNLVTHNRTYVVQWPEYSDERPYIRFATNMTVTSLATHFGEPATSFWTMLVPVLLESARHRAENRSREAEYFTAFRISSDKVEIVLISLILSAGFLLVIVLVLIICICRYLT